MGTKRSEIYLTVKHPNCDYVVVDDYVYKYSEHVTTFPKISPHTRTSPDVHDVVSFPETAFGGGSLYYGGPRDDSNNADPDNLYRLTWERDAAAIVYKEGWPNGNVMGGVAMYAPCDGIFKIKYTGGSGFGVSIKINGVHIGNTNDVAQPLAILVMKGDFIHTYRVCYRWQMRVWFYPYKYMQI